MRLGYVNYWFVEVLGSHDQFAVTNYSLNQRIVNSPLSKSNSSSLSSSSPSPNQRAPPGGRKSESPCHSPKMNLSPNMNLPNNETLNNGAILRTALVRVLHYWKILTMSTGKHGSMVILTRKYGRLAS
jgi:hypothetical protein